MTPYQVSFFPSFVKEIDKIADQEGCSRAEKVRQWCEAGIKKSIKPKPRGEQ